MKILLLFALLGVIGYYAYQDWMRTPPEESSELAPEPTPEPTPEVRLAPEGVFYVVRNFSVTHDAGIHGFPRGREIRLVRREGTNFVVTDGIFEGKASADHFTNDLDIVRQAVRQNAELASAAEEKRREEEQRVADIRHHSASQAATAANQFATKKLREADLQLKKLRLSLNNLEDRINAARTERVDKGYPSDGGPRWHKYGRITSITPDAANIRQLLEQRVQMLDTVRRMELRLEEMQTAAE